MTQQTQNIVSSELNLINVLVPSMKNSLPQKLVLIFNWYPSYNLFSKNPSSILSRSYDHANLCNFNDWDDIRLENGWSDRFLLFD